jgi:hypothetical protein
VDDEVDEMVDEEVDEEVDEAVLEDVELVVSEMEEVDEGADDDVVEAVELVISVVDVDNVIFVLPEEVVVMVDVVALDISTLVAVAVFTQEHPLDILDGRPEHAVAHAGSVGKIVAVVYIEQSEATAAEDRIIIRYVH